MLYNYSWVAGGNENTFNIFLQVFDKVYFHIFSSSGLLDGATGCSYTSFLSPLLSLVFYSHK